MKLKIIERIKWGIGILLLATLIPIILVLSLLQKINSSFETYENEMKKWHDDDFESWLAFQMNRNGGNF